MFEHNKFSAQFKPTIGADFSNKEIVADDRLVTLQIWDTAGQERFQSLGSAFYRGADCCVLVYDITNPLSFANLVTWKSTFMSKSESKDPATMPFLVLGNKCDVDEGIRKVTSLEAKRFCEEQGFVWFEVSAKDNINIEQGFRSIVTRVVERQERLNGKILGDAAEKANVEGGKQSAVASNTSRRMTRSTKTKVVLGEQTLS